MKSSVILNGAFAIVFCVALQFNGAYSFFPAFQQHGGPQIPGQEGGHHHHGGHGGGGQGGWFQQGLKQLNNMGVSIPGADQLQAGGFGKIFAGGFGNMGQNLMHHVRPQLNNLRNHANLLHHQLQVLRIVTPGTFYDECGETVRQCYYTQKPMQTLQQNMAAAEDVPESTVKPEMEQTCVNIRHVCVGNRETCVSDKTCDVAMKLTEVETEGKKGSHVLVSYINNCKLDGQSVTDNSRMPQMYFGIGFATFNEAGDAIECRKPKPSDFKLVFLWKNSTVDDSNGPKLCKPVNDTDAFAIKSNDLGLATSIAQWPKVCKEMDLAKRGSFNLKTFMKEHVPVAHASPFFSSPYDFADNVSPQYSSNKMVITGTIS